MPQRKAQSGQRAKGQHQCEEPQPGCRDPRGPRSGHGWGQGPGGAMQEAGGGSP